MKKMFFLKKIQAFVITFFATALLFAQEKSADLKVDVNVNDAKKGAMEGDWMSNPLVWVIGALVLILIIALIARGGGNKN